MARRDDERGPPVNIPARPPLPVGFALRLANGRGVSSRARFAPEDVFKEPVGDPRDVVLEIELPLDVSIIALHGGVLIFDFSRRADFAGGAVPPHTDYNQLAWREATDARQALVRKRNTYINAFLPTLYVGGQRLQAGIGPQTSIHLGNYYSAKLDDGVWSITGQGAEFALGLPVEVYLPSDALRLSAETFASIVASYGEDTFQLMPLLQDWIALYNSQQLSAALVVGWSVSEALIARRWRRYQAEASAAGGPTKINKDRRKKLNGRDFTASVMIEALSLAGRLSDVHRETLDRARQARNSFAHELTPCDPGTAFVAAAAAAALISEDAGCDFRVSSAYTFQT